MGVSDEGEEGGWEQCELMGVVIGREEEGEGVGRAGGGRERGAELEQIVKEEGG